MGAVNLPVAHKYNVVGHQLISLPFYGVIYMARQEYDDFVKVVVVKLKFLRGDICQMEQSKITS